MSASGELCLLWPHEGLQRPATSEAFSLLTPTKVFISTSAPPPSPASLSRHLRLSSGPRSWDETARSPSHTARGQAPPPSVRGPAVRRALFLISSFNAGKWQRNCSLGGRFLFFLFSFFVPPSQRTPTLLIGKAVIIDIFKDP